MLLYDFGAGALRARGASRFPFLALMLSGIANVALNLFLVAVLRMGVAGVAAATDISTGLAALAVMRLLTRDPVLRFSLGGAKFSTHAALDILENGVPAAVQSAVFCFANIFVHFI